MRPQVKRYCYYAVAAAVLTDVALQVVYAAEYLPLGLFPWPWWVVELAAAIVVGLEGLVTE